MADSMPICDVLSEAMEYLSKLGTNIRIRSENLREKRIRKDKLKNSHAIQKAVDKVLLICELSKKSIENVETGVKNLLLQMEKSSSSYDPPPRTQENTETEVKFEYFTYESRRLKIRDKISLGHYTSVKVVSTSMTMSMLEKYPVFHNCKLYRLRKRKKRESMANAAEYFNSGIEDLGQLRASEPAEENIFDASHITLDDSSTIEPMQICEITDDTESLNKNDDKNNSNLEELDMEKDTEKRITQSTPPAHESNNKKDGDHSDSETEHKKKKKDKRKKIKKLKVIDDSSKSGEEDDISKKVENENINISDESFVNEKECEKNTDIATRVEDGNEAGVSETEASGQSHTKGANNEESSVSTNEYQNNSDSTKIESEVPTVKPMIKCVSISKLLKPENVKNLKTDIIKSPRSKKRDKQSERRKERNSKSDAKYKRLKIFDSSDEEEDYTYWARKRKEVKNFKPKKFKINITRLPKVTPTLLENFNLRRITQFGTVLCEIISSDKEKSDDGSNNLEPRSKRRKISNTASNEENIDLENIDLAKNALLDDSDSDVIVSCRNNKNECEKTNSNHDSDVETSTQKRDKTIEECLRELTEGGKDKNELMNEVINEKRQSKNCPVNDSLDEFQNNKDEGSQRDDEIQQSTSNNMLINELDKIQDDTDAITNAAPIEMEREKPSNDSKNSTINELECVTNICELEKSNEVQNKEHKKLPNTEKNNSDSEPENMDAHNESDCTEIYSKKVKEAQKFKSSLNNEADSSTRTNKTGEEDKQVKSVGSVESDCETTTTEKQEETSKNLKDVSDSSHRAQENKENPKLSKNNESDTEILDNKSTEKRNKKDRASYLCKSDRRSKKLHEMKLKANAQRDSVNSHNEDKVKQSLLNGSASESHSEKEEDESNTVKTSLLADSDESQNANNENDKLKQSEGGGERDTLPDTNTLKNSLLEESETESQIGEKGLTDQIKNYLLNGSDCDENQDKTSCDQEKRSDPVLSDNSKIEQNNDKVQEDPDIIKNDLLKESDCETENRDKSEHPEEDPNKETGTDSQEDVQLLERKKKQSRTHSNLETEIVKSSLLKDSSDDHTKTPKKRKKSSDDSPPQSKRKHIMESMYAKKMLLTYSSSSDTDDEQLKNVLREIKTSLLKGISSDEESKTNDGKKSSELGQDNVEGSETKQDSSDSEPSSDLDVAKSNSIKKEQSDSDSKDTSSKERTCGSISDVSSKKKIGRSRATPGGSCSQNSDIPDAHDKEINGLINLKSLKKTYRRRSTSTDHTQSTRSSRRLRMAKAGGLISNEGFLQAESSSDAASLSGSDHADNADVEQEEMPRVKLSDINGDGIGHLAKDDLLGESDTSISHDEKGEYKKEDTDDDNVKSRRRKTHAISSDSEAGSSRRKDHDVRLSDFEDSDESSEPVKSKRKKKANDSDASGASSTDGSKKKRRRIKNIDDSDASGSDTENEGRNKHGRKNIRKVMSKNQLEEATKKAAREEKERIARISERQKLYNNLEFDESGKPDEVVLEKVVLDFDPETKDPLIQVDRGLVKKLKPHQANGIKFMWDACFESVKRIKKDKGSGCILAHCMGLGKTLQVVSLTHTLLTHGSLTGVSRVLVVCPLSTVLNWVNEFRMWLKHAEADFEVDVYELSKFKQNSERAFQLSQWFQHGGVCVLGYEMFRNLSADNVKKFKKKMLKNFQESLVDPGPDLVVCDEGHLLKNEKTSLSQSMNRVRTLRRIVLTGTPLQNNLKEYYCMVQFVKPNLLGKYNEYLNRFVNPITNGQYTDSTEHDIRVMKRRSHVLHKMLDGAVQRRDYGVLAPFLPPKHEYVLFITLTDVQVKLYQNYLDNYSRQPLPGKSSGFLFPDFQSLQRIWTHPLVLKYNSERYEIMQQKKREREEEEDSEGSLPDFIDDDSASTEDTTETSSDESSDLSDDSRKKSKKKKSAKKSKGKEGKVTPRRGTRANPIEIDDDEPVEPLEVKSENPTEWWMKLVSEDELEDMRNSHKLVLLFEILRQCEAIGDKLLVFSQSLYSLDLIEHFLGKVDDATQEGRVDEKLGGHVGSWSPGVDYFRLDGSTSCENRSIWCKNFNREDNPRARLFLISTRAGGLGINLVAANRVVIFDVSWNPSHDVQSIFRVYRFGQKKPCYIYRFLAMGTMEEKIYERQVTKQAISKRVIDEQQIDRHYAENDLAELYKFEPQPPVPRPLPPLPKDRLFAEMLKEHEAQIYKYHEHDSLLENKEEETLSEEERRAAWEDFENEKTRPPPQPFVSPYAMHNGMVPGLLAHQQQQQQQLAFAAIAAMIRKDTPENSEQQIRDAISLLYNSSPSMFGGYDYGAMYKYAQAGMMNPGMMNPMHAGSGGSMGGMGGSSGLQYEPPWQRQQQHQQQMRLQQILQQQQQQNSMGAKYYAGGLGSRDPLAMALQQQQARELMLRPRARGRPPLGARAPQHAPPAPPPADVVNLDSD
ncbi:uncharacterized protein [Epargyreus clarus]|uniref:uncharacterized protein isoform X2 n=1 Tax=Epargyreus clarus TaxID=520877 RepID=UPI003C2D8D2B